MIRRVFSSNGDFVMQSTENSHKDETDRLKDILRQRIAKAEGIDPEKVTLEYLRQKREEKYQKHRAQVDTNFNETIERLKAFVRSNTNVVTLPTI